MHNYDAQYYRRRESSPTLAAEIKAAITLLRPQLDDRILELGCGHGVMLERLAAQRCRRIIGLDWLPSATAMAQSRLASAAVLRGDAVALPFANGSFTKVVAQHLIEHFRDTEMVLAEWRRVLAPGGTLLLITPNAAFPNQDWFDDPTHFQIFTAERLRVLLGAAGYAIQTLRIINPYFFTLRFQFLAARHLQWLSKVAFFGDRGMSLVALAARTGT